MQLEKERLEKQLRFLKESFESEIITKEEYIKGKERIEKKIKNVEEEIKKEKEKQEEKVSEEKKIIEEEKPKTEEKPEEVKEELAKTEIEKPAAEKEVQETLKEVKEEPEEKIFPPVKEERNKKWLIGIIAIVIIFGLFLFFSIGNQEKKDTEKITEIETILKPTCNSDSDCKQEGKIGMCINPSKSNAECQYKDAVKVLLTIINNKECFNCNTNRVVSILKGFFPGMQKKEIDFKSEEGMNSIEELGINTLPAYIFDGSFNETYNYNKFSNAFENIKGKFVMNSFSSGANYYINRKEIKNKLDLFLIREDTASIRAEENLMEFLDLFSNIEYEKHFADDKLAKELEINTFPAFLINNKIKFSGVQPADTIKNNFCQLNNLEECSVELTKSLI